MIRFGTDGWRGIIADDFTFENVRTVTQAICDYILVGSSEFVVRRRLPTPNSQLRTIVVGYDTRFLSDRLAREAACVAAANNIKVLLTEGFAPTPAVSYAVVDRQTDGAIMLTASHNPPKYNGLKFKGPYGGSATPEITDKIEEHLTRNLSENKTPEYLDFEAAKDQGLIELFNPKENYRKHIVDLVDASQIKKGGIRVVVDPMFGAGQGYLNKLLLELGCEVKEIHGKVDPYFGGINPEPIPQNLAELKEVVREGRYHVGLALDGDADRVCAIDQDGSFISSHHIFALLLEHLVKTKRWTGLVVKTVSTTSMVDVLCQEYGLALEETPIGFKHICQRFLDGDIMMGGEESGGIGVRGHIPERDGILVGALLIEIMAARGKTLGELVRELMDRIGYFYYDRVDIKTDREDMSLLARKLEKYQPEKIADLLVQSVNTRDGYKFCLDDGSWLMIRPSGTEAVIRIYAEARSEENLHELIKKGEEIVSSAFE
jgi:alpha-D-glucose phosphate-specific phosphoglucomutase